MKKLQSGAEALGIQLNSEQVGKFELYYRELIDWNERMNLTSITDYEGVQVKHFLDSLTVKAGMKSPDTKQGLNVIDIGSGAGLPGIPLKIAFPDIKLVLLEATSKKAVFLQHVINRLGLDNVEVITDRAEVIAHSAQYREKYDLVLSRAVSSLPTLAELTLPFCTVGGRFIAQKKGDIESEILQSRKAIDMLGGRLREVKPIELGEPEDKRCLVVIDKINPSPVAYPRRPGVPAKRPLIS